MVPENCRGTLANPLTWKGLAPADQAILAAWRLRGCPDDAECYFDVPLGRCWCPTALVESDPIRRDAAALLPWRADMVLIEPGQTTLVELKPTADYRAVGQLDWYRWLWPDEYPDVPSLRPLLVTDVASPQLRAYAADHAIQVLALGPITTADLTGRVPPAVLQAWRPTS